jgi:hypothetical protein
LAATVCGVQGGSIMAVSGANDAWEYLALPEGEAELDQLSSLGQTGWELVASGSRSGESVLYFKRRLPSFREMVTLEQRRAYYASSGHQAMDTERATK